MNYGISPNEEKEGLCLTNPIDEEKNLDLQTMTRSVFVSIETCEVCK